MSVEKQQVYRCQLCGIIVEVLTPGAGHPVCCGQPMTLQTANTVDASKEKHVPIASATANGTKVAVGSLPHPMEDDHYIEWIEIINGDYVNRKYLKPHEKPEAEFYVALQKGLVVRAYCNKHGLWRN